jgi:polar amino acid transport system substrate-binding protein
MRTFLLLTLLSLSSLAHAQTVHFTTEDYPPFSYREGDQIKGTAVETVRQVMKETGADYTVEMLPWVRAYRQAETTPMTCVFATAHTAERDKLFKWIEPLFIVRTILVKRTGSPVSAATLDEAKSYTVGTWREDYTEALLRDAGFERIDVGTDFKATLKKLVSGRIDLMPLSESYLDRLTAEGSAFEPVAVLSQQRLGIACQKDFPDDLLRKMQAALDATSTNTMQKEIVSKYGPRRAE